MILLCTDTLRGYGLNRIFELAKKAGFDGIDLAVNFESFDTYNKEYLKELVSTYNIPIFSITAPHIINSTHTKELIQIAKELEIKVVILQPPKFLNQKFANWLKNEIPKLREKEQISIALENAPSGTWLLGLLPSHTLSNTNDLKKFKHVALDTSRIGEQKKDLILTYAIFRKNLVHVHISNIHHGENYAPPQEGILPLESFLTKLKQDNFPGALSLKVHPKFIHLGDEEKVINDLITAKTFLDKYYTNVEVMEIEEEDDDNDQV